MRERVRQTESGRVAWKKCGFWGWRFVFQRRLQEERRAVRWGSRWERGPRVQDTEEMLLLGGQREAWGLGTTSQSWALGVTRRGMLCWGDPDLPGYQCLPSSQPGCGPESGEGNCFASPWLAARLPLPRVGKEERNREERGLCCLCGLGCPGQGQGLSHRVGFSFAEKKETQFQEYLREVVRLALRQVFQLSSAQPCSQRVETTLSHQKVPWV